MKVILETAPKEATAIMPDGTAVRGLIHFQAKVYDSIDEFRSVWKSATPPENAATWLRHADQAGNVVLAPDSHHTPGTPPVSIPGDLLRALATDAPVAMEWWWSPLK